MRTVREIYEKYRVPPWLQLHQLRVAAVGKMVCDARGDVDTNLIVRTCLFHDIGAIVKFDFSEREQAVFQALYQPNELPYWREVQRDIITRFGASEHGATRAILLEIGDLSVLELFNKMGFYHMKEILDMHDLAAQIAQYGDMRVGPRGIMPLAERLTDVLARYAKTYASEGREEESKTYPILASQIESNVLRGSSIKPDDINEVSAAPVVQSLWDYEVA